MFQSAPRERGESVRFIPKISQHYEFQSAPRERGERPVPEGIGRKHFSIDVSRTPLQRLAERKYGWGMVGISPCGDWGFINRETSGGTAYACGSQNHNSTVAI